MMATSTALVGWLLAWLLQIPAAQAPPAAATAEEDLRGTIEQYYASQSQRDPDKAASFWSTAANPRMTRDAFVAMFGEPADDQYTVQIRSVAIDGPLFIDARVRVEASRTRVIVRDGRPISQRNIYLNAQKWRKEAGGWKLMRDGPFADELADQYLAMPAGERPGFLEQQPRTDLMAMRYSLSQSASMAITLRQDYPGGKALFERALEVSRAAGDRRGEANSLHNIAQANFQLADYAAAAEAYDRELAVGRDIPDEDVAAGALFGLGRVAYTRAEYTPALGFYRDAATLYEKREDKASLGRTVVSIGNVEYLQAEYDAAAASYRRGLTLLTEATDVSGATFAKAGMARVFAAQGDVAAALDMYGQVLADNRADLARDARLKSPVATTLESIGEMYFRLGNTDQSRNSLDEARRLSEGSPPDVARVLATLGLVELVAGRFDTALNDYTDARKHYETAKNPDGVARAWVGIGFSQSAREKYAEAIDAYRIAIRLYEQQHHAEESGRAWLGLSQAQSGARDEQAALESAGKVRTIAALVKSEDLTWRGAVRAGEALRKLERLDEARQTFATAIASIDRLSGEAAVSAEARGQLADSASAWAGLALTLARQGDAAGALAAMEARRAHVRRVQFAPFERDITRGMTTEEQSDEQGLVRELISTRAQLRAESQARHPDVARVEKLGDQAAALVGRRREQQERLYSRLPALRELRAVTAPDLDPKTLRALVENAGTLLVEYLVSDDEMLIATVAQGETQTEIATRVLALDRRAFADAVSHAMQAPALQDAGEWQARAAVLGVDLLDPIAARLEGRDRVVIVPDDLLWRVPFEALPMKASDLASRAEVTYATSLATLVVQRRAGSANGAANPPVPAFLAAPVIPGVVRVQLTLTVAGWKEPDAGASLAATRQSAAAYGEAAAIRSGADATETSARELLGTADVFHVSAPLLVSASAPLLSSIILASAGDTPAQDGRWEAREWFASSGHARVAIIPDASSFGAAGAGNAMDAIAWAASAAGASTLLLGRWPADAFAGDELIAAFHASLATGVPVVEAWRAAVGAARKKATAPSGWAGVRLIGGP